MNNNSVLRPQFGDRGSVGGSARTALTAASADMSGIEVRRGPAGADGTEARARILRVSRTDAIRARYRWLSRPYQRGSACTVAREGRGA